MDVSDNIDEERWWALHEEILASLRTTAPRGFVCGVSLLALVQSKSVNAATTEGGDASDATRTRDLCWKPGGRRTSRLPLLRRQTNLSLEKQLKKVLTLHPKIRYHRGRFQNRQRTFAR